MGTDVGAGRVGAGTGEGVAAGTASGTASGTVATGPGVGPGRVGVEAAGAAGAARTGLDAEAAVGRGRVVTGLGDCGIEGPVGGRADGAAARVSAAATVVVGAMTVAVGAGLVDRVGRGTSRKSLPPHPANNAVAMISAGISAPVAWRADQVTWSAALRLVTPFRATGRFSRPTSGWVSWPGFAFNLPSPRIVQASMGKLQTILKGWMARHKPTATPLVITGRFRWPV